MAEISGNTTPSSSNIVSEEVLSALEEAIDTHAEVTLSCFGDQLVCQPHVLYSDNSTSVIKTAIIDLHTNEPTHLSVEAIDEVALTGRRFHPDRRIDLDNRLFHNAFSKISKR